MDLVAKYLGGPLEESECIDLALVGCYMARKGAPLPYVGAGLAESLARQSLSSAWWFLERAATTSEAPFPFVCRLLDYGVEEWRLKGFFVPFGLGPGDPTPRGPAGTDLNPTPYDEIGSSWVVGALKRRRGTTVMGDVGLRLGQEIEKLLVERKLDALLFKFYAKPGDKPPLPQLRMAQEKPAEEWSNEPRTIKIRRKKRAREVKKRCLVCMKVGCACE